MSAPMGTVVIDEHVLPITALHLAGGRIHVTVRITGPLPAVDARDYSLFGRDGSQIVRGNNAGRPIRWQRVGPRDTLAVVIQLEVPGKLTDRCPA